MVQNYIKSGEILYGIFCMRNMCIAVVDLSSIVQIVSGNMYGIQYYS